jgi:predicted acylesterase/phospholipase RssA
VSESTAPERARTPERDAGVPPGGGDCRPEQSRTALCLGSSFLGFFAHAGFLDALTQLGVRPTAISGASAGALVAGAYAAGMPPREMIQWFLTGELRRAFWEWGGALRMLGTLLDLPGHTGALRGHRALELLRDRLGPRRIEECDPRLAIAATDLLQPQATLLTRGDLAAAILASAAFPGMFRAQRFHGSHYWDGGLANPLPFDHWLGDPAIDTIVVHIVTNPESDPAPGIRARMGIRDAAGVAHEAIASELLRLKTDLAQRAGKRVLFLRTIAPRPRPWNTRTVGPQCVALGAATVAAHRDTLAALSGAR